MVAILGATDRDGLQLIPASQPKLLAPFITNATVDDQRVGRVVQRPILLEDIDGLFLAAAGDGCDSGRLLLQLTGSAEFLDVCAIEQSQRPRLSRSV